MIGKKTVVHLRKWWGPRGPCGNPDSECPDVAEVFSSPASSFDPLSSQIASVLSVCQACFPRPLTIHFL